MFEALCRLVISYKLLVRRSLLFGYSYSVLIYFEVWESNPFCLVHQARIVKLVE